VCNRSGGLIARTLEEHGIPTVIVMMYKEMADKVHPPRVAHVRFPFGRPMGEPSNPDQHRVVAEDAMHILATATEPGAVVTLPYRWRREDYVRIRAERSEGVAAN
jgi:D-proline reductase (dithiol) PrdB